MAEMEEAISEEQGNVAYGHGMKAAYYNHASEKSLSHAEAKLIYKRHKLETSDQEPQSPLKRVRTAPISAIEEDVRRRETCM